MSAAREVVLSPDVLIDAGRDDLGALRTEEMLVNMGPQHPATHGVLRLVLRTDGEMVREVTPHIGYLHRCAEKIGENLPPYQFVPKTDRMDYLAAMNNNYAFALAVEKLCGMDVPERGRYVRTIMAELNRVASHLVAFGAYGLDLGAYTPFFHAFREREHILDLFEAACGARLTYSYIYPGGPWCPAHPKDDILPPGWIERCREFLDYFEPKLDEYDELLTFNHIFIRRTAGVGVISAERAIATGLTGANLRGSGVRWDLRKSQPYDLYSRFEFDVPVGLAGGVGRTPAEVVLGDCWSRYYVRMQELRQSVRIVRQCLEQMPTSGPFRVKGAKNVKLPPTDVYVEAENPRGQLGFYVEGDGSAIPSRVKARGPSFCSVSVFGELCREVMLADIPAIIGSIDIVMGECDR